MTKSTTPLVAAIAVVAACSSGPRAEAPRGPRADAYADAHFHSSNFTGQGGSLKEILSYMADDVARSTIMPIPVHQKWDLFEHFARDRMGPNYYIGPRAELQYYAFTEAMIAKEYRQLSPAERARLDPMITAFNPMDGYAVAHIKRVLLTFPGVFSGIGEFAVHKEVFSDKLPDAPIRAQPPESPPDARPGARVTLYNKSLARILDFAGESGLAVTLHNDIYETNITHDGVVIEISPNAHYAEGLKRLCAASPAARVIWAHTGLGRFVAPAPDHLELVADVLSHCPNWSVDISWDLVQAYIVRPAANQPAFAAWVQFVLRFQDRILFGSDNVFYKRQQIAPDGAVAPGRRLNRDEFRAVAATYQPLWDAVGPVVARKLKLGNYEKLFDRARAAVRAWERAHAGDDVWDIDP